MGITITEYPIYVHCESVNAYANIRDIIRNKMDGNYILYGFRRDYKKCNNKLH
jgi:hypothetical protein